MTGGPGVLGSRVILRLLAAGGDVRTIIGMATRAATPRVILETGDIHPGARVSFVAIDRDHDARRVDAVAGGEFVDDRIRLRE